ncbi:PspC domain-containing protein [Oceanobacillus alkalisoli]|uniref:PspC domain-containing protein n=1 Tax=Oceanobacillus alkalisoli TaxID=2925113 RepID=UPI001EF0CF4C|nr:PspC domain-containing protein [Oceanobacillus alkalisoli]MCF3942147.1 PspC domain-containing protein [Oceanobacillus alkalisoli]MCG5104381.1 PspC domain-containing protein [Oceanobacillus alkalisoli]
MKKLYRSSDNRYVAGVFGGLSDYLNVDATVLRVIFIILLIMSFSTVALVYLVAALIIPKDVEIY